MWGCIESEMLSFFCCNVPSLYVRVYRQCLCGFTIFLCSLTVCEGVSVTSLMYATRSRFPHCMWGCIVHILGGHRNHRVPSLYVSVYRTRGVFSRSNTGSLAVCEGVSQTAGRAETHTEFPHCMWGCIDNMLAISYNDIVPSLYVRVYRKKASGIRIVARSLTVCEGVSPSLSAYSHAFRFTHYMWWCIGNQPRKETSQLVPSLYVRLHFVNNYLFWLTLS